MTCGKLTDHEPDLDDWRPIPEEPRRWSSFHTFTKWALLAFLAYVIGAGLCALFGGSS